MIEGESAMLSSTGVWESVKSPGLMDSLEQGRMKEEIHR